MISTSLKHFAPTIVKPAAHLTAVVGAAVVGGAEVGSAVVGAAVVGAVVVVSTMQEDGFAT